MIMVDQHDNGSAAAASEPTHVPGAYCAACAGFPALHRVRAAAVLIDGPKCFNSDSHALYPSAHAYAIDRPSSMTKFTRDAHGVFIFNYIQQCLHGLECTVA